jgi:uncharacterized membrane protein
VFNQFQGDDYAIGVELGATFSGLPQPTIFQTVSDFFKGRTYVIVIIWIVGIVFLAILGYAMYSTRKRSNLSSDDDEELASREDIIAEIAALDEEHEAGNIDEYEYNDRRDELKQVALEYDDVADESSDESEPLDRSENDAPYTSDSDSDETKPEDSDK